MANRYKRQHTVPRSYLRAWTDPNTPAKHEPYVWVFPRERRSGYKKSPQNIFYETDIYTISDEHDQRNIRLEISLSKLEDSFVRIRRDIFEKQLALPPLPRMKLAGFIAACHCRTSFFRDHHRRFWQDVLDLMPSVKSSLDYTTVAGNKMPASETIPSRQSSKYDGLGKKEIISLVEKTIPMMMPSFVKVIAPVLFKMKMNVFCTSSDPGFITSDNPCTFFDPDACKRPFLCRAPYLLAPGLEITFPLSPKQLLLLTHYSHDMNYVNAPSKIVDEFNRRTRYHCGKEYVVSQNVTKDVWFDEGVPLDEVVNEET